MQATRAADSRLATIFRTERSTKRTSIRGLHETKPRRSTPCVQAVDDSAVMVTGRGSAQGSEASQVHHCRNSSEMYRQADPTPTIAGSAKILVLQGL